MGRKQGTMGGTEEKSLLPLFLLPIGKGPQEGHPVRSADQTAGMVPAKGFALEIPILLQKPPDRPH